MKYEVYIEDVDGDTLWDLDTGEVPVIEANDPWHAFKAAILYTKEKNVMPRQISVEPVSSPTSVASLLADEEPDNPGCELPDGEGWMCCVDCAGKSVCEEQTSSNQITKGGE